MHFHRGAIPTGFQFSYESYLFNTKEHRYLQSPSGWMEFHFLDEIAQSVLLSTYFHVLDGVAKSPLRAPFGGFEYDETATPELIFNFIGDVEQVLLREGVRVIEILSPSEIYSETQPIFTVSLLNQGYQIIQAEPGACMIIDAIPLQEKMNKDKRARLKQCEKAQLTFKKIGLEKLETVYHFIDNCRARQSRKLSMTFDELSKTVQTLPKSFFLVGVFDEKKMIGACICVRVSASIVYTFYSAHDPEYDSISPRVFLLTNLYAWCQKNKIKLLDLGTSALEGKPNFPLLDFKLRMGATLTSKYKFRKTLA